MTASALPEMQEVDWRESDGLSVRLLWSPFDDHAAVAVRDAKTGDAFVVHVHDDESPFDVFDHPYAYAACRRAGGPIAWIAT